MNLLDIAKTVGAGIFSTVVPGGAAILTAVNQFLPDDKKLPDTVTGGQIVETVNSLKPEQRTRIIKMQFEVDIETIKQRGDTLRTMLIQDAINPHSTRPKIALIFGWTVALSIMILIVSISYAVITQDDEMIKAVSQMALVIGTLLGPLVLILRLYFGDLREEQRNKLNASNGGELKPISGLLGGLIKVGK